MRVNDCFMVRMGLAVLMGVALAAASCQAGPVVKVGAELPAGQWQPVDRIDHSAWDALLRKYVDPAGMVDYAAWKASAADQRALDDYLRHLSAASFPPGSSREAQLAFWINAYNAVTIKGILREYPTTSIRNHTAKLYGYNIWKDLQLIVGKQPYSLEQIEHEVLRKMGEPRIHFAIVCASIGCPKLLNEAYVPERLDEQLAENTRAFFADRSKFSYDAQSRTIGMSPILKWFAEDFGASTAEQLRTIAPYLPDQAAQSLANSGQARVSYLDYDWGINAQNSGRSARRR